MNSPLTTSKFLSGPRVGHWKPSMLEFSPCSKTWAWWIMSQSSHPVGLKMKSKWESVRFLSELDLPLLPWVTLVIEISLSPSPLEESDEEQYLVRVVAEWKVAPLLHSEHFQVVWQLLGILFRPRQERWKNLPFLQLSPWHSTTFSVVLHLALQMQMLSNFIAAWIDGVEGCADVLVPPLLLNWGS